MVAETCGMEEALPGSSLPELQGCRGCLAPCLPTAGADRLLGVSTAHPVSSAKCCCAHVGPGSPSSPSRPQAEAGMLGKGGSHTAACASHGAGEHLGLLQNQTLLRHHGVVGACVGCSAVGDPGGEHAGSSPHATHLDAEARGPSSRAAEDPKPVPCLGTTCRGSTQPAGISQMCLFFSSHFCSDGSLILRELRAPRVYSLCSRTRALPLPQHGTSLLGVLQSS